MEEGGSRVSSVDNRIVNMHFNNKDFQSGAADSIQTLEELEKTIADVGQSGGMEDLGASIDQATSRFGALQIAGVAALATVASQATSAAIAIGRDLLSSATSTIFGAGKQRAIDLQQAKFQFRGLGLDVEKTMESALTAVKGTAFGLQEAATVAAQFGGSGIKAGEDMTKALRGISGIAAQTGRSYSEIGQVMTGIAGVGRLTSQDLIQFGVRGLNVAAKMGEQLGKTETEIRQMVSDGEISFKQFALLMDDAFGENATKANKTFTGSLANMKAALSRIGADIAAPRINQLRNVFNALTPVIDKVHKYLMPLIDGLARTGKASSDAVVGFLEVLKVGKVIKPIVAGLQNIVAPFVALFKAIGEAWNEVFPEKEHQGRKAIYGIAAAFELLTKPLGWLAEQIPKITPILSAFFQVIRNAFDDVDKLGMSIKNLVSSIGQIGLDIINGIIEGFQDGSIKNEVVKLATSIVDWIKAALGINSPAAELVPVGVSIVEGIAQGVATAAVFVLEAVSMIGKAIISGFQDLFGGMDALDWSVFFNTILTGGLLFSLKRFTDTLNKFAGDVGGFVEGVLAPFDQLTSTLKTMQTSIKASIILKIAIAVGILAASIILLAHEDPEKLAVGIGFLAGLMAMLVTSMLVISKFNPASFVAVGSAMVLMATSMLILSGVIAILGNMDLKTLAVGIGAMAAALGVMVAALWGMAGLGAGLPAAAAAIFIVASAMTIMAGAIALLGNLDLKTLVKGLGAISIGLQLFILSLTALSALGPGLPAAAASIFIMSAALNVMALAVLALGKMKLSTLAKGLGAMAIGLAIMVAALLAVATVGPLATTAAAAILLVSGAMYILASALAVIGDMSLGEIAKALGALAIGLVIFLAAGAAAMYLAPGLIVLGASIFALGLGLALAGAGLLAVATAFSIFAAVGGAAIGVMILAINAFLALLPSIAVQLGTAFVLFVETLAEMAPRLRTAFGEIIKGILGTIRDAIPELKDTINVFLGALFEVIQKNIPKAEKTFRKVVLAMARTAEALIPRLVIAGVRILAGVIQGIADNIGDVIEAGTNLIIAFIKGMGKAALDILEAAAETVLTFLNGLADAIRKYSAEFRQAGLNIASAIISGMTGGLSDKAGEVVDSMRGLAGKAKDAFTSVFKIFSPSKVSQYWGEMIVTGLVKGITNNVKYAVGATIALANAAIAAGDKAVRKAQNEATRRQIAAEKAAAKAKVSDRLAIAAERIAKQSPNNKALQKAADEARKIADQQAKAAQKAQKAADRAAQKVSDTRDFRSSSDQEKGDILTDRAKELSDRAIKALAKANAEALAAKKLQGKLREEMLKQAREDAKAAKALADKSKAAQKKANEFYAKSVRDRIKAIKDAQAAEEKALADQELFDKATDAGKADILQRRAEAAQKRADKAEKRADELLAQAKKLAKSDAAKAQRLLDRAEVLAQEAKDAAEEAKQDREQAEQLKGKGSISSGTSFTLSRTALEDAASSIDRYTKSLQQAEEAAAAATPVYQFVQNNTSPASLSEIEVYRQTKNLLSTAEIKMGVPTR